MKNTSKINTVLVICIFLMLNACKKEKLQKSACKSDHLELRADSAYIIVPNIFTPNGNNINDKFKVNAYNIKHFIMNVYDKRSTIIWVDTLNISSIWNGKHNAGKWEGKVIDGVYNFSIDAETINGTILHGEGEVTCISDPSKYCLKEMSNAYFSDGSKGEKENFKCK